MNWIKLSDRRPAEKDSPSGRVLVAWRHTLDCDEYKYSDWGVRSPAFNYEHPCGLYWAPIPLLPGQKPFWWK